MKQMGPIMQTWAHSCTNEQKKVGYDKGAIVMLLLNLLAQLTDL